MKTREPDAVVVGLGANLGIPAQTFRRAIELLAESVLVECGSHLYASTAVGPPQPDYQNAAVLLRSDLEPLELLDCLLEIEQRCGRQRRERWGPRTLDLDILWIQDQRILLSNLCVPHPRLVERAFALRPLLDVVPDAAEPASGRPYTSYLESLNQPIQRLTESLGAWLPRG